MWIDSAHLNHLDLRLLIMLGEQYSVGLCSSALCNFLHSPVDLVSRPEYLPKHFMYCVSHSQQGQ